MAAVDRLIEQRLHSDVALINQLGAYIVKSGGKRLRPLALLLSAGAFGYTGPHHITLAAVIEFIHTATLLHDDVVDASSMRRGESTANEVWGNQVSVLTGDFLYSRSFQMMVETENMQIMAIMADTTNTIAEGEVMQLLNSHSPDTSEAQYLDVIRCKTAKLFESASLLGPVIAGADEVQQQAMAQYGLHLGTAFQIVDDMLDFTGDTEALGKNVGDDLAEGKTTLPIIHALKHGTASQQAFLRQAIEHGSLEQIDEVTAAIESTGALAYTARRAEEEAMLAKATLADIPESEYKQALLELADFSIDRSF
ncbi:MAG TPA: octaprenyl diphosphate synthase [Acidiferrobacteraceae bacterium]|nr:octaprenyl diphosphate synthase [Acidiferrobacteraceae bacterium]